MSSYQSERTFDVRMKVSFDTRGALHASFPRYRGQAPPVPQICRLESLLAAGYILSLARGALVEKVRR